jgi:predicted nucleotidyltransferase
MPLSDDHLDPARKAANLLYARGARRVWLFGSLARGIAPDDHSDLDLAVEGIAPSRLRAIARELTVTAASKVDLVDMTTAHPRVRPHILRTRVLLRREGRDETDLFSSMPVPCSSDGRNGDVTRLDHRSASRHSGQ